MLTKFLFRLSITWGLMYLRSRQPYMGAAWIRRQLR